MKKLALSLLFLTTISCLAALDENGKRVFDSISLKVSSGDSRGLIRDLPTIEYLWEKDTTAYLEAVKIVAPVLRNEADLTAKDAALNLLTNVLNKSSPTETVAATAYFQLKDKIVSGYFNLEEVRTDKARLLMVASFLGEIRSRRIPNYKNGGTRIPGIQILQKAGVENVADLPTADLKEAYTNALKKNDEEIKMNALQSVLFSADRNWIHSLKVYGKAFPATKTENLEFYRELAERARLSEEEIKMINQAK